MYLQCKYAAVLFTRSHWIYELLWLSPAIYTHSIDSNQTCSSN